MDHFSAMQTFVHMAETGSFTETAGTLYMSCTSVTQLVQQLEARLRVRLLNHATHKLNLTVGDAAYYERVVHLLAELGGVEASLSSVTLAPRGHLRVDVPSPLARPLLTPALPELHTRYPEIQIDLGMNDWLVDLIDENIDCAIRGDELRDQSLMARQIGDLQLEVYATLAYLQRAGVPSHPRELEDNHQHIVDFFWACTDKALPYVMHRDEESLWVAGRHVLVMDDGSAYLAAGLVGLGILQLPRCVACEPLAHDEPLPLFEGWNLGPMSLYLASPPNRRVSDKLRVFIEWVAELIARHAPPLYPPP